MPDVVITEFMDEAAVADLKCTHDAHYDPALVDKPAELLTLAASCRALVVRNRTQVRGELLAAARKLVCVGRLGVGLDNIDLEACRARGVAVHPATGANDLGVAEYVIGSAMLLLRGAYFATPEVIAGKWPRNQLMGREIAGKRLGLVGYGSIGRLTANLARGLGMVVAAHDPFLPAGDPRWDGAEPMALDALLKTCDVVSLHVPLTAGTRHLIDADRLGLMKPDAILINAARGGVVDEPALAAALKAGRLGGAALDVFEEEPLSAARGAVFQGCRNLVLTPHIAGVSTESNTRVSWVTIENVRKALGG
jgi:(S)-sulfolactate dehydrogenase